jgi:hypothetical protein
VGAAGLPAEHEPELVDAFLERVGKAIDARVSGAIGVAIGSIALGIPVTAVAGNAAGLAGVIAVWIGIGFVNLAYRRSWR